MTLGRNTTSFEYIRLHRAEDSFPSPNEPETVHNLVGFHGEAGTPGSIPNPEVKRLIADDTAYLCVGT